MIAFMCRLKCASLAVDNLVTDFPELVYIFVSTSSVGNSLSVHAVEHSVHVIPISFSINLILIKLIINHISKTVAKEKAQDTANFSAVVTSIALRLALLSNL